MPSRLVLIRAAFAMGLGLSTAAVAAPDDYVMEPVEREVKMGDAIIAVRLTHKPSGKPISDAVIFAHRLDMAPDGMASMTAALESLPAAEAGVYRFKTELAMTGNWQLSLAAKIQGETGTHQSKIPLKVTE